MASGKSALTQAVRPCGPSGLTRFGLCKPSWSCILAQDLLVLRFYQGKTYPINIKAYGRLRSYHPIEQTIILLFISKPYFSNPFDSFFVSMAI
jgi:hypothetical protein